MTMLREQAKEWISGQISQYVSELEGLQLTRITGGPDEGRETIHLFSLVLSFGTALPIRIKVLFNHSDDCYHIRAYENSQQLEQPAEVRLYESDLMPDGYSETVARLKLFSGEITSRLANQ